MKRYSFEAFIDDWRYSEVCRVSCEDLHVEPAFTEFSVVPGPSMGITGGTLFTLQPQISLLDVNGAIIDNSDVVVTMRIAKGPIGGCFGNGIREVHSASDSTSTFY